MRRITVRRITVVLLAVWFGFQLLAVGPVRAQLAGTEDDAPDMTVNAQTRAELIAETLKRL